MPPDLFSPEFGYEQVDGLGRAHQRGIVPKLDGQVFRAHEIGPVIEYGNLGTGLGKLPRGLDWFDEGSLRPLLDALAQSRTQWLREDGSCGMCRGAAIASEDVLTSFKIDAHKAAKGAGFGTAAALLVAAMGELVGNVVDHSQAGASGIAIFSAAQGSFEFVVADKGVGALHSLRLCDDYRLLGDEGAALAAMVEAGVSRYGPNCGHGNGFRPIFERLADMTGRLRFRSGDYALSLDGRFGDRIGRQLAQKPRLSGFFAAVRCRVPSPQNAPE